MTGCENSSGCPACRFTVASARHRREVLASVRRAWRLQLLLLAAPEDDGTHRGRVSHATNQALRCIPGDRRVGHTEATAPQPTASSPPAREAAGANSI